MAHCKVCNSILPAINHNGYCKPCIELTHEEWEKLREICDELETQTEVDYMNVEAHIYDYDPDWVYIQLLFDMAINDTHAEEYKVDRNQSLEQWEVKECN